MTILVSVPNFGGISDVTERSIAELRTPGIDLRREDVKGYDATCARNRIADILLKGDCTHVLMVDSDIELPKDALQNLLDPSAPVVFGLYPKKRAEGIKFDCFRGKNPRGFVERVTPKYLAKSPDRIKVTGSGFGCALIERGVFERLPFPWFCWRMFEDRHDMSEDLYFCEQAFKAGVDMYADKRVMCGHAITEAKITTVSVRYA